MRRSTLVEDPEFWWPIPGYGGAYEVSDRGRVGSHLRRGRRSARHRELRVLATPLDKYGRPTVNLRQPDGRYRVRQVCALVLEAFAGARPAGTLACHRNDRPDDNRWVNLYWGTPRQNSADADRNGKAPRGGRCSWSKLDERKVIRILMALNNGLMGPRALAAQYSVRETTIRAIVAGRSWRHVPRPGQAGWMDAILGAS